MRPNGLCGRQSHANFTFSKGITLQTSAKPQIFCSDDGRTYDIFEEKKIQTQHKKSRIISGNTVVLSEAYHATSSIPHSKPMRWCHSVCWPGSFHSYGSWRRRSSLRPDHQLGSASVPLDAQIFYKEYLKTAKRKVWLCEAVFRSQSYWVPVSSLMIRILQLIP